MAVQNAVVRARVVKNRTVEIAEFSVDRRHGGNSVPLAEDEEILSSPRGIDDIDIHEAAVVQRHQWNRRRERATSVQALVNGVAALLERGQTNVGILDREQLENPLSQKMFVVCGK